MSTRQALVGAPDEAELLGQDQAEAGHGPERFYLYEYDAHQDQEMEVQHEDAGIQGATESFLLPELRFTSPYPGRCEYIGPMAWDLVDPKGERKPCVIAITRDGRRFLIGYADWPEDETRTLAQQWQMLGGPARSAIFTTWSRWRRELRDERRRHGE